MYLCDRVKSKYSMADIDKKRLVIYRSNIEDEDIDAAREALKECYPDGTFLIRKWHNMRLKIMRIGVNVSERDLTFPC